MKKFKKMLAGLLGAAMVLTSFGTPAWADSKTQTKTTATIDTSLNGSITIHKYEYNGTKEIPGTGETTDNDNLPKDDSKMKALEGAGFTIYKVADENELKNYYSTNPTNLPKVSEYVDENGKIKSAYSSKKVGEEVKTNAEGIAEFKTLALGFYVVIETTTPAKVTTPVEPFIVSVPMTTKDGDNWLYDVHVYPKNKTTYGEVTLEKQGNTDTEKLAGVTFVLQKKNGTSWETVTTNDSTGETYDLTTNASGQINVEGLSQGTYRFIETDCGNNDGYIMDGATTYEFTVNSDGTITYNSKNDKNIKITVKNEKPDMTKQVQKGNDANSWKQGADYNVGDMVPYKITIDVPSNITNLKEFTLTDTPTNLDDKEVNLQCEDSDVAENAYSVAKEGEHGFKITFTTANMAFYAGKQIVVTYNAELLDSAVTTINGNQNTAKLEYSNKILPGQDDKDNPNKPENPDIKPGKDSIEDNAVVYTFKLQILKKAENAGGTPLKDVEFDLYKEVSKETTNAITGAKAKNVGLDSEKYWLKINTDSLKTDEDGEVSQPGLANGTYYLVETKTNKDYNLLKAPVKVELNITYKTTTKKEYVTDKNGVKTLVKNEIEKTTFTENAANSTGIHTETIINKKGFELPKTGDIGTAMFLIIGIGGMLAAVYILLRGRKRA